MKKLSAEADSDSANGFGESSSSGSTWTAAKMPKGYYDVTAEVDTRGLDLRNSDGKYGTARVLFGSNRPSSMDIGKGKAKADSEGNESKDWVESDIDEQLMLLVPFMSKLKIHTLLITSLPPKEEDAPMRPKTIRIYSNPTHILDFDESENPPATQTISLDPRDWDETTGTAKVELRFVKFQNVTSLVIFVVDGEGEADRVRIDRIRVVGESGEKRDQGKLEKVGDHDH